MAKMRRKEKPTREMRQAVESINKNIFENIAYQQSMLCAYLGNEMIQIPSECRWKSEGYSYSEIQDYYNNGLLKGDTFVQATRVFEKMGYSIETYMDVKNEYGNLTTQNGLICISDSTQRDNITGEIIHGENTKSTYILLEDEGVWVVTPKTETLKQTSFDKVKEHTNCLKAHGGMCFSLRREDIENVDEEPAIILDGKIEEALKRVAPEFAELWESITTENNEKMVGWIKKESEKDSYKGLNDVMKEQVTTGGANQGKRFLGRLFGRNKEQQTESPEK